MSTRTPTAVTGTVTGQAGSLTTFLDNALNTVLGIPILDTATNERIYGPFAGNGFCLYVGDTAAGAAAGREATVRLCESSSTIGALVNPVPTVAQYADANTVIRKSNTADATTREAYFVGSDRGFELYIRFNGTGGDCYGAGDCVDGWTGDAYNTYIRHRPTGNSTAAIQALNSCGTAGTNTRTGMEFLRSADGLVTSVLGGSQYINGTDWSSADASYPHAATTKLHQSIVPAHSSNVQSGVSVNAMPRGFLPFIFEPHVGDGVSGIAHGDVYTDSQYDPASEFVFLQVGASLSTSCVLQIAGTYDPKAAF